MYMDLALLHAPAGDANGNLVHHGSRWVDHLLARSARRVVAQVDRLVSTEEAVAMGVTVPVCLVDEVIEVPFGAYPTRSVGAYVADLDHLASYRSHVVDGRFEDYAATWISAAPEAYVDLVGRDRLDSLTTEAK